MNRIARPLQALLLVALIALTAALITSSVTPTAAQSNDTPTPIPALPTFTPVPGGPTNTPAPAAATAAAVPTIAGTPGSNIMAAYFKAKTALAKAIHKHIGPVKSYTYQIVAFTDDGLNCAAPGTVVHQGYNGGYSFVYTLFDGSQYEVHTNVDASVIVICATVGGSTGGAGPAPVGGHITGGFEVGGQVQSFSLGTAGHMNQAKMKWVKFQIQVGDGSFAGDISAAHTQGFKALISYVGDLNQVLSAGYFDSYATNAAAVARAGADAIEVWNEQNLDRQWPNGQINPATYVQLLQKAYNAIHTANPNTMVISGALAPTGAAGPGGTNPAYWNDDVYYQGMAQAGAANYADCIGAHYNEGVVSPSQSSGDPRDSYPTRYFSTMLARVTSAFSSKPVCWTELGYLSPEGYPPLATTAPGFAWAQNTTVADQSQWLAQAAVLSSQSGHVRLMIVFNVDFSYYGTDPQAGYAIIRPGGTCPACDTLAGVSS